MAEPKQVAKSTYYIFIARLTITSATSTSTTTTTPVYTAAI